MKTRAALLLAFSAVLFSAATGCASPSADETSVATENLSGDTLKDLTVSKGTVGAEGALRVAYLPSNAYPEGATAPRRVFLGIAVPAAPDGAEQTVRVAGNFPGQPDVLVVDQDFVIHDASVGTAAPDTVEARVTIPAGFGEAMILVRDLGWVEPMEFDVVLQ